MKITTALGYVLLAVVSASAAGPRKYDRGIARLADEPGTTVLLDRETGRLCFVTGQLADPVAPGQELAVALDFLTENKLAYLMRDPAEEVTLERIELDRTGNRHVRLAQQYEGLPVYGGELIAHFSRDGVLEAVNGTFFEEIKVDPAPQKSSAEAVRTAMNDLESFFGSGNPNVPELIIFSWEGVNYLAWHLELFSHTPMGRWDYFVDASTGEVIFKANRIKDVDAIGIGTGVMGTPRDHIDTDFDGLLYRMIDNTRQAGNNPHGHDGQMPPGDAIITYVASTSLPGALSVDTDNVWSSPSQGSSVDGHVYSALMYDWLLGTFGRNSYDDSGGAMIVSVDYSAEGNNNAYWDGSQLVVWSWSEERRSLAGCPDVISHEWAHAVTDHASRLVYQKEPGALNESFSDMMAAAFEFAHAAYDPPDWYIAENGFLDGSYMRDMSDPPAKGDPDYYGGANWSNVEGCTPTDRNDYCGVHTNSGVGNKWFYLLSVGGVHDSVSVTGIGIENAIRIAYHANCYYWTMLSTYSEAALATVLAAQDLDETGVWETQVQSAWTAVGVNMPMPSLAFDYPEGRPTLLAPGVSSTFKVALAPLYGGSIVAGSGILHYSISPGELSWSVMTELSPGLYQATLPALACGQTVEYRIEASEATSGRIYDPPEGPFYSAETGTEQVVVFSDDFEEPRGWIADAGWERGAPGGGGGEYGGPDPSDAYSGTNIYGFNLSGDYDNNMGERHLTSPPFNCSDLSNVHIYFQRWLGVEHPIFDQAKIAVSTNGSDWTTVWMNPDEITDHAWTLQDINVSMFASRQPVFYVRFTMGPTDEGWRFCGWNIDDFKVTAYRCDQIADLDADGVMDDVDNCPTDYNPLQQDSDGDTFGDACDRCIGFDDRDDRDYDVIPDGCDNCPSHFNPEQADNNENGIGDVCDCCSGHVGDANGIGGDEPTIGDIILMIDVKFITMDCGLLPCTSEADINQSGGSYPTCNDITLGDISILIDYLFISGPSVGLPNCL